MADDEIPDLLKHAQRVAVESVAELEGPEDDIMPTFLWWSTHGLGLMPLIPMTDGRQKDRLAAAMMAALVVSRATQAVFVSTSWVVKVDKPPDESGVDMDNPLGMMPSEHPDRQECITIMHMSEQRSAVAQAILTRHPDRPPDVSEWDTSMSGEGLKVGGRFGEAINNGLSMVQQMPVEMEEIIEEAWVEGTQQDLMRRFLKVYGGMTGVTGISVTAIDPALDLPGPDREITPRQMSQRYNIPLRTIYEVCKSGVLPARRAKGKWLIDEMEAADYAFGYELRRREMEEEQ